MKAKLVFALSAIASLGVASGFTVATSNVDTFDADGGLPVVDESLTFLPSGGGVIATGFFSTLSNGQMDATNISGDFNVLGTTSTFLAPGFGNPPAIFDVSVGGNIGDGSAFIGQNVYIVIGNGADIASSTQFAVWDSGQSFSKTEDIPGTSVVLSPANSDNLVYGSIGGAQNPGVAYDNSIVLSSQPIPEPSIALLGALGVLGLIRRRR